MSNIKSFRNLLTNQTKNYKISPNYPPSEKLNGLPPSHLDYFEDTSTSCSIDGIYSIKAQTSGQGGEEVASKNDSNSNSNNVTLAGHLSKQFRGIFSFYNNCRNSQCLLTYLTPVACSFSVVIILASIAGPTAWIQTEERIPVSFINASYKTTYNISFVIKSSNASLWLLCTRQELDDNRTLVEPSKSCSHIDYFTTEEYQPDPSDSTNVLPYSITLSTPFLLFSFFILMISYILFLLAVCSQNYRIYYFIAGVCFIISGLLMLFGLIMFISIFKTEIGSKLRRSSLHGPLYSFKYGNGLILYVIGFITTELSGILNVFLFTKLQQMTQYNKNLVQLNNYVKMGNIDSDVPMNPCRRHPSIPLYGYPSINENGYIPNSRKCSIHTPNNLTKSLGNLYDHHQNHKHSHNVNFDFDEFKQTKSTQHLDAPLTRTVSTSTDIFDDGEGNKNNNQTKASSIKFTKDINASNNNKIELNNICGIMKNSNKSKENIILKNSNTNSNNNSNSNNNNTSNGNCASTNNSNNNNNNNCRVTTPKCKAKNIYYIEDTKEEDPPNIFIIDSHTLARHRRMKHYLHTNKSLDDFRTHKLNNNSGNGSYYDDPNDQDNNSWRYHYDDRNLYGSRTLPRDFLTRNHHNRPSLDNFFENYYNRRMSENFLDRRQNMSYPQPRELTVEDFYVPPVPHSHHKSFDELTSINVPKPPYQWPKTIPKSPSSYSAHSLRAHPSEETPIVAPPLPFETDFTIDEFDLDEIEYERRKSHSNLFMDVANKKSFEESIGTAV